MSQEKKDSLRHTMNRRGFLKASALVAGSIAAVGLLEGQGISADPAAAKTPVTRGTGLDTEAYGADSVIYTTCAQCQTHCSIKAVVAPSPAGLPCTSVVRKIAGNPYSTTSSIGFGEVAYGTRPADAAKGTGDLAVMGRSLKGGRTCLKGQAGIQTAFDVLRLRQPLKRVGPRGSGQWQSISWEQALGEIVGGSPDLGTPGLKSIWAYVPKAPVMADWEKVKGGSMSQAEFDVKYKDALIDTRHPDLGPKANQIAGLGGDRDDFVGERVFRGGFGSMNYFNHGGICGVTGVIANVRSYTAPKPKKRMYADLKGAEFVIIWGTNPVVANKGPTWLAPTLSIAIQRGLKVAVVDPRLSKTAEKAHIWVPIQPGTDAALALAMGRWIVENKRYDERYLRNPNQKTAKAAGEPTWSDATHLVVVSDPKRPKLRADRIGLGTKDQFVVMVDGKPVPHDRAASPADLEVEATIGDLRVKSVFTLYKERVMEQTLEQYAAICQVPLGQIVELARELTSHGKRAAVMSYRGPAMHGNGYQAIRAINTLNHLIGNHDWKGGEMTAGAGFATTSGRYDVLKVPKGNKPWGIPITREKARYEESTLFARDGYPAKRPWYPFAGNLENELLPSASDGYPYSLKALFIHRTSPANSVPGAGAQIAALKDQRAIPLLVVFDIIIGDTGQYADYILPDLTYLERWGLETIYPNHHLRLTNIMQPATRVYPEPRPVEDYYIDILKAMKLPGAGPGAFADGSSLDTAADFYLKVVANIAFDKTPVPDAGDEEVRLFEETRKRALGPFFKPADWKKALKPGEWRKVVYVLNRGGRYEPHGGEYEGELLKYRLAAQANFYDEGVSSTKDSYTGKFFDGLPKYEKVRFYNGNPVGDNLPLIFINWKSRHMGTHRNTGDAWLREIRPGNPLWMNSADARARNIKEGDRVLVKSASGQIEAQVYLTEGIKPGVVGADFSFGHTAYGSRPVEIDGQVIVPVAPYGHTPFNFAQPWHEEAGLAQGRGTGFNVNLLARLDDTLKNTPLTDPIGGGASSLDTRVEVVKLA